jgi:hypothetical protein
MAVVTIDSYSESNRSQDLAMVYVDASNWRTKITQSFTSSLTITLDSCKFNLLVSTPGVDKSTYAKVYSHSGTYGTSSLPDTLLATSDAVSTSAIGGSLSLITFSFTGANRITLSASTQYVVMFDYSTATSDSDIVGISYDFTSPSHGGNEAYLNQAGWTTSSSDLCFYVYGDTVAPTVTTQNCSSVTFNSATGNGNITATGGASVSRRGFCYKVGTSGDPTTSDSTAYDDGTFDIGAYTKAITGLSADTGYRVRAYAINSVGTSYGTTVQLTTSAVDAPTVTTTTTSRLGKTIALVGGNVTDGGGAAVTDRGIYYGTTEGEQATKVANGTGTGEYPVLVTGLTAGTLYYFKAYATNTAGTSYGDVLHFTTGADKPTEDSAHYLPPINIT